MNRPVDVVVAGPLCAGKTTLAVELAARGWHLATARDAIAASFGRTGLTREELRRAGAELEAARPGRWLLDGVARGPRPGVLDAARTPEQIQAARDLLPGCLVVFLTATRIERRKRFEQRADPADQCTRFTDIADTDLEELAEHLGVHADLVVDTSDLSTAQVRGVVLDLLARD